MAALGGSRHALINLSTQIDIPPIIKKSLSPATGYFGHKDEQSHHLNTFYVSFASVCALQMGAFCILQNFFQRNFCFRPAFEKVVCIITRKGEVLPPFDRKEVRTWNLIAENFKSNVPFKVSVNGCCTTKRATPTTKSGDAENGKYRFATLPCMRNGSFTPLYYFEGMTDVEIGKMFNTSRSTIQYRRTSSFELLKKYLEGHADEWEEW